MSTKSNTHKNKFSCVYCSTKIPFDFPEEILDAVKSNNLVIFAGAGISTENKNVFPYSLYEDIKSELKISKNDNISFDELMSRYCKLPNGKIRLFGKIKDRLDYIKSFPELHHEATKFHKELSTIFLVKDIITTNWDDYFETECGAIPIITNEDFAFWNSKDRKVLKIHGSISSYGSIVATKDEYLKCYQNLEKGIIGSTLKLALATKTLLFVGYSFNDFDFNKIFEFIKKEMGDLRPHAYLINPFYKSDNATDSKLTIIKTDGTFFLEVLKHKLIENCEMIPDMHYERAWKGLLKIKKEHDKLLSNFKFKHNPEVLFCSSYQEGLIHAFERIITMRDTGEYSDSQHIHALIHGYEHMRIDKQKIKKYDDISYIDGYTNGLIFYLEDKLKYLPMYYLYGYKDPLFTFEDYIELSKKAKSTNKSAYEYARKKTEKLIDDNMTYIHTPFLL